MTPSPEYLKTCIHIPKLTTSQMLTGIHAKIRMLRRNRFTV